MKVIENEIDTPVNVGEKYRALHSPFITGDLFVINVVRKCDKRKCGGIISSLQKYLGHTSSDKCRRLCVVYSYENGGPNMLRCLEDFTNECLIIEVT